MLNKLEKYDFINNLEEETEGLKISIGGQGYLLKYDTIYSLHKTQYFNGNTAVDPEPINKFGTEDEVISFFEGINFGKKFDFTNI